MYCTIFHAAIKPSRTSSRKLPTILQAQVETCFVCDTEEDYKAETDFLRGEAESSGSQLSPRVFIVGKPDQIQAFYVVTQKLQYRLPSFLRCLDVVIKLKLVMNFNFSESCELFWCFVLKYFYDVDCGRKSKNSQLLELLSFLEKSEQ